MSTDSPNVTSTSTIVDDQAYEVNIWYNENDLLCFSGERIEANINTANTTTDTSAKVSSSVGSVGSLNEPFPLPGRMATNSTTINSSSSTKSDLSKVEGAAAPTKIKQTVVGTVALCKFVVEHFQTLGRSLSSDKSLFGVDPSAIQSTPLSGRRGKVAVVKEAATPTTASKRKRGDTAEEDEVKTSAKKSKKEATPSTPAGTPKKATVATPTSSKSAYPEKVVLARWIDRMYYAGRVIEKKPNNKFVVLFEDGANKTLTADNIVFGNKDTLPLENEYVHAKVKDDTYEPGLVQSIKAKGDTVCYVVACETITVTVTASDIYLEEEQAKVILAKQESAPDDEPEPGFSGTVSTRKDRRQKRYS